MKINNCEKCVLRSIGIPLGILSTFIIGLGIADVALTYCYYCKTLDACHQLTSALALSWVGIGIWAAIPAFAVAVGAIYISGRLVNHRGWLCLLTFMVAFFFAPAIIVVTCFEMAKKFADGVPGSDADVELKALFGIEILIIIFAFIVNVLALILLYYICFRKHECSKKKVKFVEKKAEKHTELHDVVVTPQQMPQVDDRCNLFSGYRWMNHGPCPRPIQPMRCLNSGATGAGNYYGVGMGNAGACQMPRQVLAGGCTTGGCRM